MWAITSERYTAPVKDVLDPETKEQLWRIYGYREDENYNIVLTDYTVRREPFVYTIQDRQSGERASFIYDGSSVKPAPRTLRLYGAEALRPLIAKLSKLTNRKPKDCYKVDFFDDFTRLLTPAEA